MSKDFTIIESRDDWRVPYIGRIVRSNFCSVFGDKDGVVAPDEHVRTKRFPWEDAPSCESGNCFDTYWNDHYLQINLFEVGPLKGRIKSIAARHTRHFHTTSNWQDHAESSEYEVRVPNKDEIGEYKQALDSCTKASWDDVILELFMSIAAVDDKTFLRADYARWSRCWRLDFSGHCVRSDMLAKILQVSLSCLDVWLADEFAIRNASERRDKDGRDLLWFMDQVDIESLYCFLHLPYKRMKDDVIERMAMSSAETWAFLGVSEKVALAMLRARLDEVIGNSRRNFRIQHRPPVFFWQPHCGRVLRIGGVDYSAPKGIPPGSLCYLNKSGVCVGYATQDGDVFEMVEQKPAIGHITEVGGILSATDSYVAMVDARGVYEVIDDRRDTYAYVSNGNMVFANDAWDGSVMECVEADGGMKALPYSNDDFDIRLGLLAFFADVDRKLMEERRQLLEQKKQGWYDPDVYD